MELPPLYALGFAVGTTLVLLGLFRIAHRVTSPDATVGKSFSDANAARHLLDVGQVLGVFMVAAAAVKNCVRGENLVQDIVAAAEFGVLGLVLVTVMGRLGTLLLLRSRLPAEIARGNVAAGLAAG